MGVGVLSYTLLDLFPKGVLGGSDTLKVRVYGGVPANFSLFLYTATGGEREGR